MWSKIKLAFNHTLKIVMKKNTSKFDKKMESSKDFFNAIVAIAEDMDIIANETPDAFYSIDDAHHAIEDICINSYSKNILALTLSIKRLISLIRTKPLAEQNRYRLMMNVNNLMFNLEYINQGRVDVKNIDMPKIIIDEIFELYVRIFLLHEDDARELAEKFCKHHYLTTSEKN